MKRDAPLLKEAVLPDLLATASCEPAMIILSLLLALLPVSSQSLRGTVAPRLVSESSCATPPPHIDSESTVHCTIRITAWRVL
jgi:hypothetical protein